MIFFPQVFGKIKWICLDIHAFYYNIFYYCVLFLPSVNLSSQESQILEGQASYKLHGWGLKFSQFHGLIIKRFHCAKRNTKGLFSQILLPAFFVCVAMTVALSVPEIGEFLLVISIFTLLLKKTVFSHKR